MWLHHSPELVPVQPVKDRFEDKHGALFHRPPSWTGHWLRDQSQDGPRPDPVDDDLQTQEVNSVVSQVVLDCSESIRSEPQ